MKIITLKTVYFESWTTQAMKNLIYDKFDYNDRIMLLQLETTNEVPINTNEYNSLYHITVTEIAPNKKLIKCGVKPLQVFNRLVVINSLLSDFTFTTCYFELLSSKYPLSSLQWQALGFFMLVIQQEIWHCLFIYG